MRILGRESLWPIWVVLALGLLLLPRLGSYGFWEPQEMAVAARALPPSDEEKAAEIKREEAAVKRDKATLRAQAKKDGKEPAEPTADELAAAAKKRHKASNKKNLRPPLAGALVERGIGAFGVSEWGARLPFVVLAMLAGLATFLLGARVRNARAGLWAVLILAASPLFVFQARQLTGELGALAGGAFMLLGAIGLCSPKPARAIWLVALDVFYLLLGAGLAYYDSGFFVGILAPAGAIAIAAGVSAFVDTPAAQSDGGAMSRLHMQIAAAISLLVFAAVLLYFTLEVFDWVEAKDSEFSLFGKTFHANSDYNKLLAGVWKQEGNLKINFNSLFEQVAFGMFPWICLAPIAVARMASGGSKGTNPLGARMLFAWAALTWVICTIALRKIGPVQFAAVPAIAVAVGVWIDQLQDARKNTDAGADRSQLAPPLIALFALFAVIVLAKDIKSFPAEFLGVHLDTSISKFPEGISLHKILMVLGGLFGLSLAAWLYFWNTEWARRVSKWALRSTIGISLVLGVFLSQAWTPSLSTKLSSRATFNVYQTLKEEGNVLGVMGKATDGAKFYAGTSFETISGRAGVIRFLRRPERVFALVKSSELCPIHKESSKQGFDYYVVDDSNADKIILSNRMWNKDVPPPPKLRELMQDALDRNPLSRYIVREKPKNIKKPLDINFDDKLQLIGIDMPEVTERGDYFDVKLYYKVLAPIRRNFQVFMHFDGSGVRFQGDHWPVKKRCGTNHWQTGDYVIDEFSVEAGSRSHAATKYKVWTGLFVGSAGNWENMKAVTGDPDDNNRVAVGTLRLE